jgi:K+-transporting ATPase KdpF subunit
MPWPARGFEESMAMNFEYLAGGILVVLVSIYLVYALIRPEHF